MLKGNWTRRVTFRGCLDGFSQFLCYHKYLEDSSSERFLDVLDGSGLGIIVEISSSLSVLRIVVLPALSRPSTKILASLSSLFKVQLILHYQMPLNTKVKVFAQEGI